MKEISIREIGPVRIGQAEDAENGTGCTVFVCEEGMRAGLDVRGGGPASRESQLLNPLTAAQQIHAIVLAGGSAYGLDAAGGVMQYLEEHVSEFYDRGMELRTEGQRNGTWMNGSLSDLQPLSGHMGEAETVTGVFEDGVPATIHPFILEEAPESFDTLVVKFREDRVPSDYPFGPHFFLVRDKAGKWFHITPDFPILPEQGGGQEVFYGFFGSNDLITDEFRSYFPGITAIAGPFPVSGETAAEANFNIEFYAYSYQTG